MTFGERIDGYDVPVLNEREARAGAGILFFFAMTAFMNAWFDGNYTLVQLVILGFFGDFFLRVIVSPRLAPSLILGRFFVRNQTPEFVGAAQKYFAWVIGFWLATVMLVIVVIMGQGGTAALAICMLCLVLLFFETAFGICIGCLVWNAFMKTPARLCPGGVCEVHERLPVQKITPAQILILAGFAIALVVAPLAKRHLREMRTPSAQRPPIVRSSEMDVVHPATPPLAARNAVGVPETALD